MKKTRLQSVGFTVIELLVAIVITSAMLLLINQIFVTSSRAVGRGIGLSDIIANGSAAANQFDLDTELMVGPHEGDLIGTDGGGILIIVNKLIYAPLAKPFGPDTTDEYRTHADDQQVWRWVRSDQLVFIRRRVLASDLRELPLAPASQNAFSPGDDGGLAKYIRIWYGHVQRTDIDGASPIINDLPAGSYFIIGTAPLGQVGVTWSLPLEIESSSDKRVALTLNNSSWSL